jgi:hypothetical protein
LSVGVLPTATYAAGTCVSPTTGSTYSWSSTNDCSWVNGGYCSAGYTLGSNSVFYSADYTSSYGVWYGSYYNYLMGCSYTCCMSASAASSAADSNYNIPHPNSTTQRNYTVAAQNVVGTLTSALLPGANINSQLGPQALVPGTNINSQLGPQALVPGANINSTLGSQARVPGANISGWLTSAAVVPGSIVSGAVASATNASYATNATNATNAQNAQTANSAYSLNILTFTLQICAYDPAYSERNVKAQFTPNSGANIVFSPNSAPSCDQGTNWGTNYLECDSGGYSNCITANASIVLPPGGSANFSTYMQDWAGWEGHGWGSVTFNSSMQGKSCYMYMYGGQQAGDNVHRQFAEQVVCY